GQSVMIYVSMHKGTLPYGRWDGSSAAPNGSVSLEEAPAVSDWTSLLYSTAITKRSGGVTFGELSDKGLKDTKVFLCPTALPGGATDVVYRTTHFASHPRLMPDL